MVRCDEFYEKWNRAGNFCEKNPRTAEQINAYLDEMRYLETIATQCNNSRSISAIAHVRLSENALRPLIREKNINIHKEVAQQLVKLITEKAAEGDKFSVTADDVHTIVSTAISHQATVSTAIDGEITVIPPELITPKTRGKRTFEEAAALMLCTIETLIEEGFSPSAIGYFMGTAILRHMEYLGENPFFAGCR